MSDLGDASTLSSQLSSHGSSEFGEDIKEERDQSPEAIPHDDTHLMPSAKRRRIGQYSHQSTPIPQIPEDLGDISSDTSGSIPGSPMGDKVLGFPEDDSLLAVPPEQITVCKWRDCTVGDLGNMDNLVQHVHDEHIGKNKKRYACEWEGCNKKENASSAHASGYALKAHMRSHTKEKPFYCHLPECDRSFTRSDALAKHMRTVHETEALRPSDPVPKGYGSIAPKPTKLKLLVKPQLRDDGNSNGDAEVDDDATIYTNTDVEMENLPGPPFEYPEDVPFTGEELSMPPDQLFRLLRRQVHWAVEEGNELREEVKTLEEKKKREWMAKELVLANVMEAELAHAHEKGESDKNIQQIVQDLPQPILPLSGPPPWYRMTIAPVEMPPGEEAMNVDSYPDRPDGRFYPSSTDNR